MSDVKLSQIGHLAYAPEMSYVGEGENRLARTTIAVISNKRTKDRNSGEIKERTSRVRWTLFGTSAENATKYLSKGSHVSVNGRLENNDYEKDGETKYEFNFIATEIEYLDSKVESEARAAHAIHGQSDDGNHNG